MDKTKVLIVDDHQIFCESLSLLLSIKGDVEVVGMATSGEEAIRKVERLKPEIVLMDIEMRGIDGIDATRAIRERFPAVNVIILSMHANEEYILEAIKAGAKGYVSKDVPSSDIIEAISSVKNERVFFDAKSGSKLMTKFRGPGKDMDNRKSVGAKEKEVLSLIAEGLRNKEIAEKLVISIHTVRNHVANIFMKLNCTTRTKAVREAQKKGLI